MEEERSNFILRLHWSVQVLIRAEPQDADYFRTVFILNVMTLKKYLFLLNICIVYSFLTLKHFYTLSFHRHIL